MRTCWIENVNYNLVLAKRCGCRCKLRTCGHVISTNSGNIGAPRGWEVVYVQLLDTYLLDTASLDWQTANDPAATRTCITSMALFFTGTTKDVFRILISKLLSRQRQEEEEMGLWTHVRETQNPTTRPFVFISFLSFIRDGPTPIHSPFHFHPRAGSFLREQCVSKESTRWSRDSTIFVLFRVTFIIFNRSESL